MGIVTIRLCILATFFAKGEAIMCSQCDSDRDSRCLKHPPPPRNCTLCSSFDEYGLCISHKVVDYCITEKRYINDTLIRITRDCSPYFMPYTCQMDNEFETPIKVCFSTCKESGCNGSDSVAQMNLGIMFLATLTFLIFHV